MGNRGIMLYFEFRPCLEQMTAREKGELFEAMLSYGESGQVPKLSEKLQMVWPLFRQRIDRDRERYDNILIRNQYANYAKSVGKNDQRLSYDQWKALNFPNGNRWDD